MIPKQMVIFCGGRGERLRPLTDNCPKPLLPINGKPFLDRIISGFHREFGIDRFVLLAGYLGHMISEAYYEWGRFRNLQISTFVEQNPLGTAIALRGMRDCLDQEFIIANGDTFPIFPREAIEAPLHGLLVRSINIQTSDGLHDCGVRKCSIRLLDRISSNVIPGTKLEAVIESNLRWIDHRWYDASGQGTFIDIGTLNGYERAKRIFR